VTTMIPKSERLHWKPEEEEEYQDYLFEQAELDREYREQELAEGAADYIYSAPERKEPVVNKYEREIPEDDLPF
jgi:hypothetical protein